MQTVFTVVSEQTAALAIGKEKIRATIVVVVHRADAAAGVLDHAEFHAAVARFGIQARIALMAVQDAQLRKRGLGEPAPSAGDADSLHQFIPDDLPLTRLARGGLVD